jgi:hypothetical protein
MHRCHAYALALCAFVSLTPASGLDAPDFTSAREKSMGGRHVALADDYSVLLTNPAGLAVAPKIFSAADLSFHMIGPVFDIADLVTDGDFSTESLTDFLDKNDYKLYAGLDVTGPLALGYTGGGLGFGLFNKTRMIVNVASASSIGIKAEDDLLLSAGYALRFDLGKGHELDAGVSAKGFVFGDISKSMGIVEAVGLASDPTSIFSDPFTLTTGIGLDLGLRWSWEGRVGAGLVYRDAYSPAISTTYESVSGFVSDPSGTQVGSPSYDTLPSSLDLGLMYAPSLGRLGEIIDSLVVALDYKDILGLFDPIPRNAILNVGLGVEARVLDIVSLRMGIADALPAAGGSLDLDVFVVNLSVYGTELGLDPGDRPCYNLLVDFDFKY